MQMPAATTQMNAHVSSSKTVLKHRLAKRLPTSVELAQIRKVVLTLLNYTMSAKIALTRRMPRTALVCLPFITKTRLYKYIVKIIWPNMEIIR